MLPCGILLVDKPEGPTSRTVTEGVGRVLMSGPRRRRDGRRFRVGHAGTLDPLATGLLVVLVGRGTRIQPFLQGLDKRYLATVRLGVGTDSLDRDGEVTARTAVPATAVGLSQALAELTGTILQEPPVISAIKRGGRSLHHRVREGEEVAPPPARQVRILGLEAVAVRWAEDPPSADPGLLPDDGRLYEVDLDIACGSGTYIRSLARDLAVKLGTVGHVAALRRVEVGTFRVEDSVTPADLAESATPADHLLTLADALPHLPALRVTPEQATALCQGRQPEVSWFTGEVPALFRIVAMDGELVAVGRLDGDTNSPRTTVVFPEDDACA